MLSTFRSHRSEATARVLAERATDAALHAAEAAIRAADAAIKAADAAVRLIDEHSGEVIVLEPSAASAREKRPELAVREPWPHVGLGLQQPSPSPSAAARRARRLPRVAAVAMLCIGVLLIADAAVTLVWQEPFSALYAKLRQDHLSGALAKVERTPPTALEQRTLAALPSEGGRIEFLARELERRAANGSAVGRIIIPRIDADFVVVKGTDTADLQSGPGIYPETPFPGVPGTTAIAGHRTTFLAPFRHINALQLGSRILLELPYAHFVYKVAGMAVVPPTDVSAAVGRVGYSRLVLSACTPLFSAEKRLLVFARLAQTVPVGAGLPPVVKLTGAAAREPLRGGLSGEALSAIPADESPSATREAEAVGEARHPPAPPSPGAVEASLKSGARSPRAAPRNRARLAATSPADRRALHRPS